MSRLSRLNGFKFLLILSILCYLSRPVLSDCLNSFVDGVDYFPRKAFFNDDGQGYPEFTVTYFNSYIIVINNRVSETYVLYCTAIPPVGTNIPADNSTKFVQVPAKNVATYDPATVSFLEILGKERSLKYVGDKSTITSPCLLKHNDLYETMIDENTTEVASVDVIFTNQPQTGAKFVTVSIDENATALRRAQWIKFVSLFFNNTAVAINAYNKVQSNYYCHSKNVNHIPKETRKTIAWVSLESLNNFTVKFQSFYPIVTLDAAAYPLNNKTSSGLTVDDLHQKINDAYIVIDVSILTPQNDNIVSWKYYFGYDQVSDLPGFLKENRLYRTRKLLNQWKHDDWTETSPSRPDILLQDLIAMQYPSYQKDYNVTWFNKFAETEDTVYVSEDQCNEDTFGHPKTEFGTCTSMDFTDDGKDNSGKQKVQPGVIIAVVLTGALVVFGLGAWLLVVMRRKYRERFVKLRDEPVNSVNEPVVQMDSVKEVK